MQENELDMLKDCLKRHGVEGGLQGLLDISVAAGERYGITVKPTCDAKYLEVGISSKSDNVDRILEHCRVHMESARRSAASGVMNMWELKKEFTEATASEDGENRGWRFL